MLDERLYRLCRMAMLEARRHKVGYRLPWNEVVYLNRAARILRRKQKGS